MWRNDHDSGQHRKTVPKMIELFDDDTILY